MAKGAETGTTAGGIALTQAELETLVAGFKQIGNGAIDMKQLAADIGGDLKPGAVSKRWSRLKEKICGKSLNGDGALKTPTTPKTTPKKRASPAKGGKVKKQKVEAKIEEEEEGDIELEVEDEAEEAEEAEEDA